MMHFHRLIVVLSSLVRLKSNAGIMEDLYMWKDMLLALFNLIDYNHSGEQQCTMEDLSFNVVCFVLGFISRNEFSDIVKLILYGENGTGDVNEAYVEELTSAMDFDKNGKIDFNEFLGKYNPFSLSSCSRELFVLSSRELSYCQC